MQNVERGMEGAIPLKAVIIYLPQRSRLKAAPQGGAEETMKCEKIFIIMGSYPGRWTPRKMLGCSLSSNPLIFEEKLNTD